MRSTLPSPPAGVTGPLAGVRLIEMDAIGPVPVAAMLLAGLGADVVRIARPGAGVFGDAGAAVLHRSRTRVTLDLKRADARDRLLDLAGHADGLVEGARPGVMERLGVGPAPMLARNPRLVYARVTGWGQDGPLAATAGHDINYIALAGALNAIGEADRPPAVPLNLVGDYGGGAMFAALGLVAGVLSARATGEGGVVDVAMVDGVANLMGVFHALLAGGLWSDARAANLLDGAAPFYRCYRCAGGGDVAVGALEPRFYAALLAGLGLDTAAHPQHDRARWPATAAAFAQRFSTDMRDAWTARFEGTDACVTPVLSMTEAFAHPANRARGVFTLHDGVAQAVPAPRMAGVGAIAPARTLSIDEAIARWR